MDKNDYIFEEKTSFIDETTGVEVFILKNFISKVNSKTPVHFKGKYFAIKYGVQYGHLLIDYIGSYLHLKKYFPDLKLVFFKYEKNDNYLTDTKVSDFMINFFNPIVIDVNGGNYLFDEFIFCYTEDLEFTGIENLLKKDPNAKLVLPIIPSKIFLDKYYYINENSSVRLKYKQETIKALYNEFSKYREKKDLHKKIYISRPEDRNIKASEAMMEFRQNIRYRDDLYYDNLNNLIQQKGYKIFNASELSFLDQINLFYNADTVVTIDGTSVLNGIWCKNTANIIKLYINKQYKNINYNWDNMLNATGKYNIDIIDVTEMTPESGIEFIFNSLP